MKLPKILLAAIFAATLASCEKSPKADPAPTAPTEVTMASRDGAVVTKAEDFDEVFATALETLESSDAAVILVKPADGGYIIQVQNNQEPGFKQRVCCNNAALAFGKCVGGYVDQGKIVQVGKCSSFGDTCGKYCAYID